MLKKKKSTSRWIDFLNEPNLEKQLCLEAKSRKIAVQGAKLTNNFARISTLRLLVNEEKGISKAVLCSEIVGKAAKIEAFFVNVTWHARFCILKCTELLYRTDAKADVYIKVHLGFEVCKLVFGASERMVLQCLKNPKKVSFYNKNAKSELRYLFYLEKIFEFLRQKLTAILSKLRMEKHFHGVENRFHSLPLRKGTFWVIFKHCDKAVFSCLWSPNCLVCS